MRGQILLIDHVTTLFDLSSRGVIIARFRTFSTDRIPERKLSAASTTRCALILRRRARVHDSSVATLVASKTSSTRARHQPRSACAAALKAARRPYLVMVAPPPGSKPDSTTTDSGYSTAFRQPRQSTRTRRLRRNAVHAGGNSCKLPTPTFIRPPAARFPSRCWRATPVNTRSPSMAD